MLRTVVARALLLALAAACTACAPEALAPPAPTLPSPSPSVPPVPSAVRPPSPGEPTRPSAGPTPSTTSRSGTPSALPSATTSTSTTTSGPTTPDPAPTTQPSRNYEGFSNRDLSWWYRPATGGRAAIDADVEELIGEHHVIWQRPAGQGVVHLTMDEGYEYEDNTTEILDIAAAKGVRIAFFITGSYLDRNPELVRRMVAEGHQVANHSVDHLRPSEALADSTENFIHDVLGLEQTYAQLIGQPIAKLYRPPEGGYSARSLQVTDDLGYTTVFWSFAYRDWETAAQPDPDQALARILGELHDGSVLLLHAVSDTNVEILPQVIDGIRDRGYTIGLLPSSES